MKAATFNGNQAVTSNHKVNGQMGWTLLIKRLKRSFDSAHQFDWEKRTGISLKVGFIG